MTPGRPASDRWSAAAHVFVDDLEAPVLGDDDAHHLGRVLRLREGEVVTVSDGAGRWRRCRVVGGGRRPGLDPDGPIVADGAPSPPVGVALALAKGDRPEWAVQKLTEIGVDVILPLRTARSVVRWEGDRADRGLARLNRVVREAAMQSRRTRLPEVRPVADVAGALSFAAGLGTGACAAVPGGGSPHLARSFVLVGPEGGWAPGEISDDVATLGLGPTVLRTETAAVTAASLLVALRSGVVSPTATPRGEGAG